MEQHDGALQVLMEHCKDYWQQTPEWFKVQLMQLNSFFFKAIYPLVDYISVNYESENYFLTLLQYHSLKGNLASVQLIFKYAGDTGTEFPTPPPLHLAAMAENTPIVECLVEKGGCDVNELFGDDDDGLTPLETAIVRGHVQTVRSLVKLGARTEGAIKRAVKYNQIQIVTELVGLGVDVDDKNEEGFLSMHSAANAQEASVEMVRELARLGAKVDSPSVTGSTPLYMAIHSRLVPIAKELIALGARNGGGLASSEQALAYSDAHKVTAAAAVGNMDFLQQFIAQHKDIASVTRDISVNPWHYYTCLHWAAWRGDVEMVKLLVSTFKLPVRKSQYWQSNPLREAVLGNHIEMVRELVKMGADVNDTDSRERALSCAILQGNVAMVKELLHWGCEADQHAPYLTIAATSTDDIEILKILLAAGCPMEDTVVHAALEKGLVKVVEELIKAGATINTIPAAKTLLHAAARGGNPEAVRKVLGMGVDVSATDGFGQTALHEAVTRGHPQAVDALLTGGAVFAEQLWPKATEGEKPTELVEVLIRHGIDVNIGSYATPLHYAVQGGNIATVRLLLKHGADLNGRERYDLKETVLHYAVGMNNVEVARELLLQGASVDLPALGGVTPLMQSKSLEMQKLLLEFGANVSLLSDMKETVLHTVLVHGNQQMVYHLIQQGLDVNTARNDGETALHVAVSLQKLGVVRTLLRHGANPNCLTASGCSPLHYASKCASVSVVQALLMHGADVNVAESETGYTALHRAAAAGQVLVVNELLENGAYVNPKSTDKSETPLHLAAKQGSEAIVRALIIRGADMEAEDSSGQTPILLAAAQGHQGVVKLLTENGANANVSTADGVTIGELMQQWDQDSLPMGDW